jgi:hypothetical protein
MIPTLHGEAITKMLRPDIIMKRNLIHDVFRLCRLKKATLLNKDNRLSVKFDGGIYPVNSIENLERIKLVLENRE